MTQHNNSENKSACCTDIGAMAGKLGIGIAIVAIALTLFGYFQFKTNITALEQKTSDLHLVHAELDELRGKAVHVEDSVQFFRDLPEAIQATIVESRLSNITSQLEAVAVQVTDEFWRQKLLDMSQDITGFVDGQSAATVGIETEQSQLDPLQRLAQGNMRFVDGTPAVKALGQDRRTELLTGQHPFAVILSCSDSRVPPELLFDQGLGDLFVVRVAGNILDPVVLGSIEYAVEHLQSPLLVVLGHEKCGAVQATVDGGGHGHGNVEAITRAVYPVAEAVQQAETAPDNIYEAVTDENVRAVVRELHANPVIEHLVAQGKLTVVGAKYWLDSGKVEFF